MSTTTQPKNATAPAPARTPTLHASDIDHLVHADHWDHFGVLGPHAVGSNGRAAVAIRAFLPDAHKAWVVDLSDGEPGRRAEMERLHPDGLFEAVFTGRTSAPPYRLA